MKNLKFQMARILNNTLSLQMLYLSFLTFPFLRNVNGKFLFPQINNLYFLRDIQKNVLCIFILLSEYQIKLVCPIRKENGLPKYILVSISISLTLQPKD